MTSQETKSPLTAQQIELIQVSYEQLLPHADAVMRNFYQRAFQLDPSLRASFKANLEAQGRKFFAMLRVTVKALDRIEQVQPALTDMGRRHFLYGCVRSQYATLRKALLWALQQEMQTSFTPELETAWGAAYDLIAEALLGAYGT